MAIFVTGAAGFIGYHVCKTLLARGELVIGFDNLCDYYDVELKKARLDRLSQYKGFVFFKGDICDKKALREAIGDLGKLHIVVHLAAQAGVRYSLINPTAYIETNILGYLNIVELCKDLPNLQHLIYASSSSVYGGNTKIPFSESHSVDNPVSLYAASKKADELIGHVYSHLYNIPSTGLRFFTVYGPWGRPDMAAFIFTEAIFKGVPIKIFNDGHMHRDFTFIDDVVRGIMLVMNAPPKSEDISVPNRIYNIGNNRSEPLLRFVEVLERATGLKAKKEFVPMQPGDVKQTYADIDLIRNDHGYEPSIPIDEGIPLFVEWYRQYYNL